MYVINPNFINIQKKKLKPKCFKSSEHIHVNEEGVGKLGAKENYCNFATFNRKTCIIQIGANI